MRKPNAVNLKRQSLAQLKVTVTLFGCLFGVVSFRVQITLEPRPDWSPLGFNSNFPTSIPVSFIWEPPPGGC